MLQLSKQTLHVTSLVYYNMLGTIYINTCICMYIHVAILCVYACLSKLSLSHGKLPITFSVITTKGGTGFTIMQCRRFQLRFIEISMQL